MNGLGSSAHPPMLVFPVRNKTASENNFISMFKNKFHHWAADSIHSVLGNIVYCNLISP